MSESADETSKRLTLDQFTRIFTDSGRYRTRTWEGAGTSRIYDGSALRVNIFGISSTALHYDMIPVEFEHAAEFEDGPYRSVWYSDAARAVITYCEGDLSVEIAENDAAYEAILRHAVQFYSEGWAPRRWDSRYPTKLDYWLAWGKLVRRFPPEGREPLDNPAFYPLETLQEHVMSAFREMELDALTQIANSPLKTGEWLTANHWQTNFNEDKLPVVLMYLHEIVTKRSVGGGESGFNSEIRRLAVSVLHVRLTTEVAPAESAQRPESRKS